MKLLQTTYNNLFIQTVSHWDIKGHNALFHVFVPFNMQNNIDETDKVREILGYFYPDIPVIGCSATGEIYDGTMCDREIVVSAMIFEDPRSRVEVFPYYAEKDYTNMEDLLAIAESTPDLKGIEILTAAPYQPLEAAGEIMDRLPEDVEIFGGVAVGDEFQKSFIFANDCEYSRDSSACVMYIGPELHIQTDRMLGWKSIGYPLTVTRSEGAVVYEINGMPAYDVYNHYLHIHKDNNFFYDALQFPWEVQVDDDTTYIRHAKSVNPDGSILMSTNIPEGSTIRITFGDPRRMMNHTKQSGSELLKFSPQVVYVINCFGRKLFWNDNDDAEVSEISRKLETTGFSALGELLRYNGTTLLNNLSIVCVAMREGPIKKKIDVEKEIKINESNIPVTHRLAIFINTITDELMEKNKQLNEMLYKASHDALTDLLNRGAIEREIYDTCDVNSPAHNEHWHLIMLDIDDFKALNDQYGHSEGDNALKALADYLKTEIGKKPAVEVGRWGGEEFMIILTDYDDNKVLELAEKIRKDINNIPSPSGKLSVSIGVTNHHEFEAALRTIDRVDGLLYDAKNNGKNKICSDLN
ncbi:diguanylate cyclase (GGDEF) domain-containing protein [Pseudobutyrivibrio sp. OR37]|uniref:sensor domain-containing diguanylate cyclase n=1 Tax=Pseudobutyrivibrio sp. OR37 TaxID=1798186 RepID=UPI0008E8F9A9|nr:diguanylate cyclase [Pseudobutyrivibrio sp. OR37]SFI02685.1 diguanylate cyclase (GGDEF) domain-containing protein [Pseudobutyrivibrio sp. OR37]